MSQWGPLDNGNIVETVVRNTDELGLVLPGAQFGLSRTDRGIDETRIGSSFHAGVSGHEMHFGFTVIGGGAIDDSSLLIGAPIKVGPTPTFWDGVEATVGDVLVYGPRSAHQAFDAVGLVAEVLCLEYESLRETADVLGVDIGDWEHRRAWLDGPGFQGRSILDVGSELDPDGDASALLSSVALTLSSASFKVGSRRNLSSREIVGRSFEYLEVNGSWFPPIAALCKAVWVSERRLRQAFVDCFDLSPSHVLRVRALSAVYEALRIGTTHNTSVSSVAIRHGFRHLGDFARYYRAAYGETPSQTLRGKR